MSILTECTRAAHRLGGSTVEELRRFVHDTGDEVEGSLAEARNTRSWWSAKVFLFYGYARDSDSKMWCAKLIYVASMTNRQVEGPSRRARASGTGEIRGDPGPQSLLSLATPAFSLYSLFSPNLSSLWFSLDVCCETDLAAIVALSLRVK